MTAAIAPTIYCPSACCTPVADALRRPLSPFGKLRAGPAWACGDGVTPAKAGVHMAPLPGWIPAFAGMTEAQPLVSHHQAQW